MFSSSTHLSGGRHTSTLLLRRRGFGFDIDPDGAGLSEDIDGNGQFTFFDVFGPYDEFQANS